MVSVNVVISVEMACVKRPVSRTRAAKMQVLCVKNVLTRTTRGVILSFSDEK